MPNSDHDRVEPSLDPASDTDQSSPELSESNAPSTDQPDAQTAGDAPTAPETGAAPSDPANPDDEAQTLRAQVKLEQERYMRAMAEMENVRRRAAEDVSKAHKFSIESFAEALIPVKDSLEMALKVENPTTETYQEGIEATLRQLSGAFDKNKLVEIDPLGQKFDPNHHQAISMVPASATNPPVEPNHVASVLQKGYLINDRVLRPALVTVVEA